MGPPPIPTVAVTFSFEEDLRPEEAGTPAAAAPAAAAVPARPLEEGEVLVRMAMTGAAWHVQAGRGATGRELKQAVAVASGIPAREIQLMRGGARLGESEEVVTEKQECVAMVRVRKPRVLVRFELVHDEYYHSWNSKQQWVEDPENTRWDHVSRENFPRAFALPVAFQFPGVRFSTDRQSALKLCSIASLVRGEITDEMLEQDRLRWQRQEAEDLQRAKDDIVQWRLAALQNGKRPCGCGWCNCSDFDQALDVQSGRLCRCGHSVFEHMGEKFRDTSRTASMRRTLLGAVFGQR